MAVDDGEIFFFDGAVFPDFSQLAGGDGIFGDENDAAGFAVETIDDVRGSAGRELQIKAHAADETGILIAFGRVTNEAGGFVDDQQVGVFKNDFKQRIQFAVYCLRAENKCARAKTKHFFNRLIDADFALIKRVKIFVGKN